MGRKITQVGIDRIAIAERYGLTEEQVRRYGIEYARRLELMAPWARDLMLSFIRERKPAYVRASSVRKIRVKRKTVKKVRVERVFQEESEKVIERLLALSFRKTA